MILFMFILLFYSNPNLIYFMNFKIKITILQKLYDKKLDYNEHISPNKNCYYLRELLIF